MSMNASAKLRLLLLAAIIITAACGRRGAAPTPDDHAGQPETPSVTMQQPIAPHALTLPASGSDAGQRLTSSPRHAEWAMISAGRSDSVRVWVVFPEKKSRAPVVIVVHEIFGLSTWIRAVADQLAADGFIAIAPDFLTGKNVPHGPDGPNGDSARVLIRTLAAADIQRRIDAVARYGIALPAALPRYGIVGFCWGGGVSFDHAVHAAGLGAAVVYYGRSPDTTALASIRAPVLGLYGENDARVNASVPPADSAMRALGKTFLHLTYSGAGHGFLRAQEGPDAANREATERAWPATLAWFRRYLGE